MRALRLNDGRREFFCLSELSAFVSPPSLRLFMHARAGLIATCLAAAGLSSAGPIPLGVSCRESALGERTARDYRFHRDRLMHRSTTPAQSQSVRPVR